MVALRLIAILIVVVLSASETIAQEVPNPIVTTVITSGDRDEPFGTAKDELPSNYLEEERFLSGTARSFKKLGPWRVDGRWATKPSGEQPYTIRILIRRPITPTHFNGIVVVEWLNVSAQVEGAADYAHLREELLREGYIWVGVGAQSIGINAPRTGLKAWDPIRYGSLSHPGDSFSYDIFSQSIQALRNPQTIDPLEAFEIRHVIATGRSQSAMRLVTYINAVHPLTHLVDGYLVHSRGANPAGLTADRLTGVSDPMPTGAHIRTDIDVPVLDLQAEGDMTTLRSHLARQDPHTHFRRWEIAGAAHAEVSRWVISDASPPDAGPGCATPVNAAPHHAVAKAALHALVRWVREDIVPPQSPLIELGDFKAEDPIARDRYGNARGGIRLPQLEAPTATLDGRRHESRQESSGIRSFCFLFGHTVPFGPETLAALYPTHDAFVSQFTVAVETLEQEGYLLRTEANQAKIAAQNSRIGR